MTNNEKRGTRKIMEYEDAPSGSVMLYNYKEPFMKFEEGFGFQGVLLFDTTDDRVQCHLCGEWYGMLAHHLKREHALTTSEYKSKVGLRHNTALLGEKVRASFIANGLESRKRNLANRVWTGHTPESRAKISASLLANRTENQNKHGTCPEQLLQRIRDKYLELGRQPLIDEVPGHETIKKIHGSWTDACRAAGIEYIDRTHEKKNSYTEAGVIAWILNFAEEKGHLPSRMDARRAGKRTMTVMVERRMGGWEHLVRMAITGQARYEKTLYQIYTSRQLIVALTKFKTREGRDASPSDCRRGLLPEQYFFQKHFGSFNKALTISNTKHPRPQRKKTVRVGGVLKVITTV